MLSPCWYLKHSHKGTFAFAEGMTMGVYRPDLIVSRGARHTQESAVEDSGTHGEW